MKKIILSLLVLFSFSVIQAQITDDQYKSLIPIIKTENWKEAFKASSKILKDAAEDKSENAGLVRFLNVYAAAGMVKDGSMKFEKMQKIANKIMGKNILSANFMASMNPQNTLNKTLFTNFDAANKGFTIVTNKFGKIIFYVEYDIVKDIDPKSLHGTMVSCGGVIKEVEINPDKKTDWILKIRVADAFIR